MMRKGLFVELPQRRQPLASVALCGVCRLYQGCKSPFMPVWGDGKRKVMVIGESPGETEDLQGKPFVGKAGQRLRTTLDKLGVDLDRDCFVTNSIICRPKDNQLPDKAVDFCRPNVVKAIKDFQPEVIVLLGAAPVKSVLGWLWKEDPKGISRWAGFTIPCQSLNTWICPTWHPSYLLREEHPVLDLQFEDHLRKAFSKKGRPWKTVPKWEDSVEIILDDVKAGEVVKEYNSVSSPVAWDLECNMLKPDSPDARIYSCSLSDGKRTISFPWLGKVVDAMKEFLRSSTLKVGWNLKYDNRWAMKEFGFLPRNTVWDGMLAAHAIDNRKDSKGLKFQSFAMLGYDSYSDYVEPFLKGAGGGNTKNRIHEADLKKILLYGGLDALLTHKIVQKQAKLLGTTL